MVIAVVLLAIVGWVGIPVERAISVVETHGASDISTPTGLVVHQVAFRATDGVHLKGWMAPGAPGAPIVILVAGFKSNRMTMVPYARMLHRGRYNVLLYDSRDTGQSGGTFTLGAREVDDVLGAIRYVVRDPVLKNSSIGLLGVSLGAGEVIVAAAEDRRVKAIVADSAYADQNAVIDAMNHLQLIGPITVPLAPLAGPVIDRLGNITISSYRPVDSIGRIAPRAVFLIHSLHDQNATTPMSGVLRLLHAGRSPISLWIAPRGGHAGALAAQPVEYRRKVLAFFRRYLVGCDIGCS